jgi:hypothetical protein
VRTSCSLNLQQLKKQAVGLVLVTALLVRWGELQQLGTLRSTVSGAKKDRF